MENNKNAHLFEDILRYVRKLSGYNLSLSYKELEILKEAVNKGMTPNTIKKLIKEEIKKYPLEKRKKFNLFFLEKRIKEIKKNNANKLTNIPDELEKIAQETITINHIWKNLPKEEKKEIVKTAVEKMKKSFILTNIDRKRVLRSIIRNIIKERYINGGNDEKDR